MAPTRPSRRRNQHGQEQHTVHAPSVAQPAPEALAGLFQDPIMGTPMPIFVVQDVPNRETLVELISKHGGNVVSNHGTVQIILVDPHRETGQNLWRQYGQTNKKLVLSSEWVYKCIQTGGLQTFQSNYAGCKVTGAEGVISQSAMHPQPQAGPSTQPMHQRMRPQQMHTHMPPSTMPMPPVPGSNAAASAVPAAGAPPGTVSIAPQDAQSLFPFNVFADPMGMTRPADAAPGTSSPGIQHAPQVPTELDLPPSAPPQSWEDPHRIAPHQAQMETAQPMMPPEHQYPPDQQHAWNGEHPPPPPPPDPMGPHQPDFDERYRDAYAAWATGGSPQYYPYPYYDPTYAAPYYPTAGPSNVDPPPPDRGRKRTRTQPQRAPPASTLVVSKRNPDARSPTPPTRVIKSTYGGNLFTSDDIDYLKKYIEYCQEQGLVLSLREICERVALKAPHHTFYSWRRYCNKHQIRLGGYAMETAEHGDSPTQDGEEGTLTGPPPEAHLPVPAVGPGTIAAAKRAAEADIGRARSPTPPRALFRSTTGKGVAFTDEDVTFLVRYLEYKGRQGKIDMVAFWKDVALKAPHHSRASWMKFYRRHKHELNHTEADEPLPVPPEKKMRYSRSDDVLLAKHFVNKPDGTSDKIFQAFARTFPHHPWKGWQEHHRIHKLKIDELIVRLKNGENIDEIAEEPQ